jgi:hypothetical protein
MSKLVVRALRCVEETNEIGSDDAYMVVFRGSFNLPPDVKVVGGKNTAWGNMSTGKLVVKDMVLDEPYKAENAYVAALLEQDSSRDILTDGAWAKSPSSGPTTGRSFLALEGARFVPRQRWL